MPPNPVEIEFKLCAPPEVLRRLSRRRLLRGDARPVARKLSSVYFDTPQRELWRRGVALRVRRVAGKWVQTVKGGGTARGGLHERVEFECEVPGPAPDVSVIPRGPLTAIFAAPEFAARLEPVFATAFMRRHRLVTAGGVTVEVCVDRGQLLAGERKEALSEIELELKSGTVAELIAFVRQLVIAAPLRLEDRSKAERGYALAGGESRMPARARPVELTSELTVIAAFRMTLAVALAHLQANQRGTLEEADPEYLHQMRVALRRMRSMFRVFAAALPAAVSEPVVAEMRWLATALGPARDWDVFVAETFEPVHREFGKHPGFGELARRCSRARHSARERARRAVGSRRYQLFVLAVTELLADDAWLNQLDDAQRAVAYSPAAQFATEVLAQRYAGVRQRGRKLDAASYPKLHRLRIAVKKLRYAADAFSGLFESAAAVKLLARLARLQDILGYINDTATAGQLLETCGGTPRTQALLEARGVLRGWGHGRVEMQRSALQAAWKAFRAVEKFW